MDQKPTQSKTTPVQQTSPEEDATLLAIEALEAQSVDLDAPKVPAAPAQVQVAPTLPTQPTPQQVTPPPVIKPVAALKIPVQPPVVTPVQPSTPAQAIAAALASDTPAPKRFQFFVNQKPPRKPFVIGGILAVLIGLGVAAYFTLV